VLKHIYAGELLYTPAPGNKKELKPLPWQQALWHKLVDIYRHDRLGHANILSGPLGLGGDWLAYVWAAWLLCEKNSEEMQACGDCMYCRQFLHASHPDMYYLSPEPHEIKIDAVRALTAWLQQARHYTTPRVVLVLGVQSMNLSAANAFLKSVEEPPAQTYFIMTSTHTQQLLATLRSRVQSYHLSKVSCEVALHWLNTRTNVTTEAAQRALQQVGGLPIDALKNLIAGNSDRKAALVKQLGQLLHDSDYPGAIIQNWSAASFDQLYLAEVWLEVLQNMLQQQLCQQTECGVTLTDKTLCLPELWKFYEQLQEWLRALHAGLHLNVRLNLEHLLYHWRHCVRE